VLKGGESSQVRGGEAWGREEGRGEQQEEASGSLTRFQHSQVAEEHPSLAAHNSSPDQLEEQLVLGLVVVVQDLAAAIPG